MMGVASQRRWGLRLGILLLLTVCIGSARAALADPGPDSGPEAAPDAVDGSAVAVSDAGAPGPAAQAGVDAQPATTATASVEPPTPSSVPLPSSGPSPWALISSGLSSLQVHAFVSQGFILGTENNYLVDSKRGSFDLTEVGINFTQILTDQMRMGMQLYARRLGDAGDFTAQLDWLYLDYRFWDWLGLRVGRTKIPFGLYNEEQDADPARIPAILPQAVYEIENSNLLLAQTGAEAYGYLRLASVGGLEYRLYGGTLYSDPPV